MGHPAAHELGPPLNMVTELPASYAEVAARGYGAVAYVRDVAEEAFVGDSDDLILAQSHPFRAPGTTPSVRRARDHARVRFGESYQTVSAALCSP